MNETKALLIGFVTIPLTIIVLAVGTGVYNDYLINQYITSGMDPFTAKCIVSNDLFSCGKTK